MVFKERIICTSIFCVTLLRGLLHGSQVKINRMQIEIIKQKLFSEAVINRHIVQSSLLDELTEIIYLDYISVGLSHDWSHIVKGINKKNNSQTNVHMLTINICYLTLSVDKNQWSCTVRFLIHFFQINASSLKILGSKFLKYKFSQCTP